MKGWEKIFHVNSNQKRAAVIILISDKIDFNLKRLRDKRGHYILIKVSTQQETNNYKHFTCLITDLHNI